jgi:hypothetical protein
MQVPARAVRFCVLIAFCGCGDDPPPPPPTKPPPKTSAKPVTTVSAALPSASASASSSAAPVASFAPTLTGPLKWADFAGPELVPVVKAGDNAWAVLPVSAGWETLKFTVLPVSRVEGNSAIFQVSIGEAGSQTTEVFVPGAFTVAAHPPEKLVADDAVMVATSGSRAFGRVVSAPSGGKAKVRFRYAGTLEERDVDLNDVVELDGTMKFGAPVGYSEQKEEPGAKLRLIWHPAQLVHTAEDKAWVVTASGKPIRVALSSVKVMGVGSLHKAGDKVWAGRGEDLLPGQVAEALDGGTRYKIKLEEGTEITSPLESVTTPLQ